MGPTQLVAQHLCACVADSFAALDIAAETGLTKSQVYSALHYYVAIGAVDKTPDPTGRTRSLYRVADREELERRKEGRARRTVHDDDELPPLQFFVDSDGDLQLVREGEEPLVIPNRDARRLVGFVALQASAILMAGA
jgi:hypothetical protein